MPVQQRQLSVGVVFVLAWGCVCYCVGVVFVIVGVVFVIVWVLCLLLSFLFGCSNLIM